MFVVGTTNRFVINSYNITLSDFMTIFHPLRKTALKLFCRDYVHHSSNRVMNGYSIQKVAILLQPLEVIFAKSSIYSQPSAPAMTAVTIKKIISVSECSTFQAWRGSLITEMWSKRLNPFIVMASLL